MNAAVNAFFLILKLLSLYFLVVSLFSLCKRKMQKSSAQFHCSQSKSSKAQISHKKAPPSNGRQGLYTYSLSR